jgi:transposase-like protein
MLDELKALERQNRELRQANEILHMISFIDYHREAHGSSRSAKSCR